MKCIIIITFLSRHEDVVIATLTKQAATDIAQHSFITHQSVTLTSTRKNGVGVFVCNKQRAGLKNKKNKQ